MRACAEQRSGLELSVETPLSSGEATACAHHERHLARVGVKLQCRLRASTVAHHKDVVEGVDAAARSAEGRGVGRGSQVVGLAHNIHQCNMLFELDDVEGFTPWLTGPREVLGDDTLASWEFLFTHSVSLARSVSLCVCVGVCVEVSGEHAPPPLPSPDPPAEERLAQRLQRWHHPRPPQKRPQRRHGIHLHVRRALAVLTRLVCRVAPQCSGAGASQSA